MVRVASVRSILNRHRKRDEWFLDDYSLNPYQLCEFNCIYVIFGVVSMERI